MTILNAYVLPEVAHVGVDTFGWTSSGEHRPVGKMFTLVHAGVVVAGRGNLNDIAFVASRLNCCATLDEMCKLVPELMLEIMKVSSKLQLSAGLDPYSKPMGSAVMQLQVFGWSHAYNRIDGQSFTHHLGTEGFNEQSLVHQMSVGPWDPSWGTVPDLRSVSDMCIVARRQVELCRRDFPDTPHGGELIVAELRKGSMRISKACDLP